MKKRPLKITIGILALATGLLCLWLRIQRSNQIRMAELARLDWKAVDLDRRFIEVRAGQAKTASRRLVPITDNLAAWLRPLERKGKVVRKRSGPGL